MVQHQRVYYTKYDQHFAENYIIFTCISVFYVKANKVGQMCSMFFWTWWAGLDADFQKGQFTGMAENVVDILLSQQNGFCLQ